MMYRQLTKVIEKDGQNVAVCINQGTEKCFIHSRTGIERCEDCPIHKAILEQLYNFETAYLELLAKKGTPND